MTKDKPTCIVCGADHSLHKIKTDHAGTIVVCSGCKARMEEWIRMVEVRDE